MITYLAYANVSQKNWTRQKVKAFSKSISQDSRIKSFKILKAKDRLDRIQICIHAKIDEEEILETCSPGRIAGLLHCSTKQAEKNKEQNKKTKAVYANEQYDIAKKIEQELKEHKTDIKTIIYIINCLSAGKYFERTDKNENAVALIDYNQNKGSGNWYKYLNYNK